MTLKRLRSGAIAICNVLYHDVLLAFKGREDGIPILCCTYGNVFDLRHLQAMTKVHTAIIINY